jgi:hypothetical protein
MRLTMRSKASHLFLFPPLAPAPPSGARPPWPRPTQQYIPTPGTHPAVHAHPWPRPHPAVHTHPWHPPSSARPPLAPASPSRAHPPWQCTPNHHLPGGSGVDTVFGEQAPGDCVEAEEVVAHTRPSSVVHSTCCTETLALYRVLLTSSVAYMLRVAGVCAPVHPSPGGPLLAPKVSRQSQPPGHTTCTVCSIRLRARSRKGTTVEVVRGCLTGASR